MLTLLLDLTPLIPAHSTIILGLSGGPDSVFLLHQLVLTQQTHPFKIVAAHLDHQWHPASKAAREFCARLCQQLQSHTDSPLRLTFISKSISDLDFQPKNNGSLEDRGRQYRRYFFQQLAQQYQPARIWLAHHADDQIETVLLRLIRGTSLTGLTGMQAEHSGYVRPLLHLPKAEILAYLAQHQLPFFTDPTNSSPAYLRNRLRQQAIPALQACDPRFAANFLRSIAQLQASEQFLAQHTQQVLQQLLRCPNQGTVLDSQPGEGAGPKPVSSNPGSASAKQVSPAPQKQPTAPQLNLAGWRALDPYLQKRVLLQWLQQAGVQFTLTEKFLQELLRFLLHANPHAIHQFNHWQMVKRAGYAQIV